MASSRSEEPLSIRQLEIFVALIDQGSFTKAAEELSLSQSTVSGHVADLERRLGLKVVDRGRRGVQPTAAGEALLGPARETLLSEKAARMTVQELTGLLRGELLLGGSSIPATYLLPSLLSTFHLQHPGVSLRLQTGDSREILDCVVSAHVEVGVIGTKPERGLVDAVEIARDRLVLVLRPTHPLARRSSVTAAEAAALPLVMREPGSGTRAATLAMLEKAGVAPLDLDVVCEVGSTEGLKAAVREGLGAAFLSDLAVREELASGALAAVSVDGGRADRLFYMVSRKDAWLSPAAHAFMAVAKARTKTRAVK